MLEQRTHKYKETMCTLIKPVKGLTYALLACIMANFSILLVKILSDKYSYNPIELSFLRSFGIFIISLPIFLWNAVRKNICAFKSTSTQSSITYFLVLFTGSIRSLSTVFQHFSLQKISIGDFSTIVQIVPLLLPICAKFCLKESLKFVSIFLALTGFCGVLVCIQPPFLFTNSREWSVDTWIGISFAAGCLPCSLISVLLTRKLQTVHWIHHVINFGIFGILETCILFPIFQVHPIFPKNMVEVSLIFGMTIFAFFEQYFAIFSLQVENVGPLSLVKTLDVVFAFVLQYIVLNVEPNVYCLVGGFIVLCSVTTGGILKYINYI